MDIFKQLKIVITGPSKLIAYVFNRLNIKIQYILGRLILKIKDDKSFIRYKWKLSKMGYKLDLDEPKSYNEKLQWLKLYDRKPEYTIMVDKVKAKEWVAKRIGKKYIIPNLGVWEDPDDIDFDKLPNQFVLKCNHNSGTGLFVCTDKKTINKQKVLDDLKRGLKQNYYYHGREWPYKNVHPLVLAEKYMVDESGVELKDYKIFNFNGEPKIIEIDFDRFNGHKRNLYDVKWNLLDATIKYPSDSSRIFEKPEKFDELLTLARELSKGIPHLRTDFYIIGDNIYFGELTFFHECGFGHITPLELDFQMGTWLTLPHKN